MLETIETQINVLDVTYIRNLNIKSVKKNRKINIMVGKCPPINFQKVFFF